MLLVALALLAPALPAQVTPVQPIVKGTGLPLTDSDEAQVMAAVDAWFAGLDDGNAAALAARVRQDGGGGVTVAATAADGGSSIRHLGWPQYLGQQGTGGRLHEHFTGTPAIEVDGDIAMVWGDYVRSVGGRVAACGVDHFDLVRESGAWRVQNLTVSQRIAGCPAQ